MSRVLDGEKARSACQLRYDVKESDKYRPGGKCTLDLRCGS